MGYFLKFQNIYESNFDYEASYKALSDVLKGVDITRKGLISFRFKPKNIEVLLSPKGKVQVTWASKEEKEQFIPVLKSLLVPPQSQKLTLKPVEMNIYKVPFPGPKKFRLAWCKRIVTYIQVVQNFIAERTFNIIARVDDREISNLVNQSLQVSFELKREFEKKSRIPIIGPLLYGAKLRRIIEKKMRLYTHIAKEKQEDFDFIEKCTEIKVEHDRDLRGLDEEKLRDLVAKLLFNVIADARSVAEMKGQKFSPEKCGLNIVVSFNPKKRHASPYRPTLKELITARKHEIENDPSLAKYYGFNIETLERLEQFAQEEKELRANWLHVN